MSTSADTSRKMTVRTLVPFLGLTFGLTWGLAAVMILFADQVAALFGEMGYTNPLYVLAVYGPAFAAVILVARYYGFHGLGSYLRRLTLWRMSPRWWSFLVLGIPLIYYIAAAAAGTITDPFGFEPWYGVLPALLLMLVLGPMEEFGWRGVALPLLQRRLTPLASSLIIGVVWAVWHLPAFFIGGTPHYEWMFVSFFAGVVALSVIMTAIFNASRGSILIAALFHFQINNPIWPNAQPWDTVVFSLGAVLIVLFNRERMLTPKGSVTGVLMPEAE